jgi:hypothetical protein
VSQLTAAQLDALRTLQAAYPDAAIAIIGATALAFHIDMTWRMSVDLDLVIAASVADLDASKLPDWLRHPKLEHSWKTDHGVLVDLVPAPADAHSPWRDDEEELRNRVDALQSGFEGPVG